MTRKDILSLSIENHVQKVERLALQFGDELAQPVATCDSRSRRLKTSSPIPKAESGNAVLWGTRIAVCRDMGDIPDYARASNRQKPARAHYEARTLRAREAQCMEAAGAGVAPIACVENAPLLDSSKLAILNKPPPCEV